MDGCCSSFGSWRTQESNAYRTPSDITTQTRTHACRNIALSPPPSLSQHGSTNRNSLLDYPIKIGITDSIYTTCRKKTGSIPFGTGSSNPCNFHTLKELCIAVVSDVSKFGILCCFCQPEGKAAQNISSIKSGRHKISGIKPGLLPQYHLPYCTICSVSQDKYYTYVLR